MYFIRTDEPVDNLAKVNFTHYQPDLLPEAAKQDGFLVEPFEVEEFVDKTGVAYYNIETKEIIIKYIDKKKTMEQLTREDISNIYYTLMNGGLM